MDVSDFKRHLFAATVVVAATLSPSVASAEEAVANTGMSADEKVPLILYVVMSLYLSFPVVLIMASALADPPRDQEEDGSIQGKTSTSIQPSSDAGRRLE